MHRYVLWKTCKHTSLDFGKRNMYENNHDNRSRRNREKETDTATKFRSLDLKLRARFACLITWQSIQPRGAAKLSSDECCTIEVPFPIDDS